jgi:hypothetical protein
MIGVEQMVHASVILVYGSLDKAQVQHAGVKIVVHANLTGPCADMVYTGEMQ